MRFWLTRRSKLWVWSGLFSNKTDSPTRMSTTSVWKTKARIISWNKSCFLIDYLFSKISGKAASESENGKILQQTSAGTVNWGVSLLSCQHYFIIEVLWERRRSWEIKTEIFVCEIFVKSSFLRKCQEVKIKDQMLIKIV